MMIDVRFFATLKDRIGKDRLTLDLDEGATVADLVSNLSAEYPSLVEALPTAIVALNHEYAFDEDPLRDGDEVAFFPPVSGGIDKAAQDQSALPEYFAITEEELDLNAISARITLPSTGAIATFTGKVRGSTQLEDSTLQTDHLVYEAYEEMAEAKLRQVAAEIRERWPLVEGIALVQRIGRLEVGTTTVLVACAAGHRDEGIFEAARFGIDRLKEIVPVWKKEVGPDGEEWVEGHYHPTPEDASARVESATIEVAEVEDVEEVASPTAETPSGLHYVCPACGEAYPLETTRWRCECGSAFDLAGAPAFDGERVEMERFDMWRYRAMLLPDEIELVSLGEGWTPLITSALNGREVHLKVEGLNPTGSFKDRGTAVHVSVLRALGITSVHDDSSGNAGASLAAYAARAGLSARIFAPASASGVKLAQMTLCGAALVMSEGPRSAATLAAEEAASQGTTHYASHAYSPLTILGMKTLAYEIWEQLGARTPDVVVVPAGQGSQVLGMAAGFRDLLDAGAIDRLPRLIAVQAAACAPLWAAFTDTQAEPQEKPTLAEGIRIVKPVRPEAVLKAVRDSGGSIVTVEEHEIMDGMRQLARLGVMVEATSAVVVPAVAQIEHLLPPDSTIVLSLTGSGFKAPELDGIAQEILLAQTETA